MDSKNTPKNFLKKGQGKLGSQNHGITKFAKKRQEKIIKEQLEREEKFNKNNDKK